MVESLLLSIVYMCDKYQELHFMQAGASSHFALPVPGLLDNHVPALRTGCREPTEWPKGRPSRTPHHFLTCDWTKLKFYLCRTRTLEGLEEQTGDTLPLLFRSSERKVFGSLYSWAALTF
jgi:hypothetical protein